MTQEELDTAFEAAFERASNTKIKLPDDLKLHFYAYYKRATIGSQRHSPSGEIQLRNAFKLNALLQIQHLSQNDAKRMYIDLVNKHIVD